MIKILVIEGDKLIRWSLGEAFRQSRYQLDEAATWNEALNAARQAEFRLILADVEIQDEQSLAQLKEIQHLQPAASLLILSSDPIDKTESALRKLGRFRVIEKPYSLESIKAFVRDALNDEDKNPGAGRS